MALTLFFLTALAIAFAAAGSAIPSTLAATATLHRNSSRNSHSLTAPWELAGS